MSQNFYRGHHTEDYSIGLETIVDSQKKEQPKKAVHFPFERTRFTAKATRIYLVLLLHNVDDVDYDDDDDDQRELVPQPFWRGKKLTQTLTHTQTLPVS